MDFSHRSNKKELIDDPAIAFEEIRINMQELASINTLLGGHTISIEGLKKILHFYPDLRTKNWHICEVGCGGGDNLKALSAWCTNHKIKAAFSGIDINPNCIEYAKLTQAGEGFTFITSDYRDVEFQLCPDILFSSLFCHHFSNEALKKMINWMGKRATCGFFINDLHRHRVAYHSIKILTRLFSRSRLVKHDAPLSVARGFVRKEWKNLLTTGDFHFLSIEWKWAFRWLVVAIKNRLDN